MVAAKIDAPVRRERLPKKRPATKHLPSAHRPLYPSVREALLNLSRKPHLARRLPPLASRGFPSRATVRTREIIRRTDGQLMLAALLRSGDAAGLREGGWSA